MRIFESVTAWIVSNSTFLNVYHVFDPSEYSLIDFGDGRKLERFKEYVIDRPSPAAEFKPIADPESWETASTKFIKQGEKGKWKPASKLPKVWTIEHAATTFELKPTQFGHLGVFPEQAENWDWIRKQVQRTAEIRVLNLFAYTGGSTIAAAAAGAEVTHVDAAKNVVSWARRNAELSGLSDAPIRWIVEDCLKFVSREVRRKKTYHAIILDPPSYGHGPKGEVWKLTRDLMTLLNLCNQLLDPDRAFLLLTCHSPGFRGPELNACVDDIFFGRCQTGTIAKPLRIKSLQGNYLDAGWAARWSVV